MSCRSITTEGTINGWIQHCGDRRPADMTMIIYAVPFTLICRSATEIPPHSGIAISPVQVRGALAELIQITLTHNFTQDFRFKVDVRNLLGRLINK